MPTIEDVNDFFRIKLDANERDTVNSMIVDFLHRFPREDEVIKMPRVKMQVIKMTKNVVEKVKVHKLPKKVSKK